MTAKQSADQPGDGIKCLVASTGWGCHPKVSSNQPIRFDDLRKTGMDVSPHEMNSNQILAGACLCGDVRYRVEDSFVYALNCHCSRCRKATGSAFKPFAGIERSKFSVIQGEEALSIFGDEKGHDARCKRCGAFLYSEVRDGQYVHVTFGTLVDTPSIRPTAHIFVGSKAAWYTINDDLPQHQELP
jgi:hypothetical protein